MRQSELERLNQLKAKKERGETLTEKETSRLQTLTLLKIKEEKENGRTARGSGTPIDPGTDVRNGGGEGSESRTDTSGGGSTGRADGAGTEKHSGGFNFSSNFFSSGNNSGAGRSGNSDGSSLRDDGETGGTDGENRGSGRSSEPRTTDGGQAKRGRKSDSRSEEKQVISSVVPDVAPAPEPVEPKRKTRKASKKAVSATLDAENLSTMLTAGFGMVAAITAKPHWAVDKKEADSIAAPLETVLLDLTPAQVKQVEKYTAPIVLIMATAGVVVPRVLIDLNNAKMNKERKIENVAIKNEPERIPQPTNARGNETRQSPPDFGNAVPSTDGDIAELFSGGD